MKLGLDGFYLNFLSMEPKSFHLFDTNVQSVKHILAHRLSLQQ